MIRIDTKSPLFGGCPVRTFTEVGDDGKDGRVFRQFVIGMAWPINGPGYIVVIGEELDTDKALDANKLHIIDEYEHPGNDQLVNRCAQFIGKYHGAGVYGDTSNRPMMESTIHIRNLYVKQAPFCDQSSTRYQYYISLIRGMASATRKILHFGDSNIVNHVRMIDDKENPAILSLGYALAAIQSYGYYNHLEEQYAIQPEEEPDY